MTECVNSCHKMMVLTETFLAVNEALSSEASKSRLLLQALDKENLYSFFAKKSEQHLKEWQQQTPMDAHHHEQMHWLGFRFYFHPDTPESKRSQENIRSHMQHLDSYYLQHKLRYTCEMVTQSKTVLENHEIWLFARIDEHSGNIGIIRRRRL